MKKIFVIVLESCENNTKIYWNIDISTNESCENRVKGENK